MNMDFLLGAGIGWVAGFALSLAIHSLRYRSWRDREREQCGMEDAVDTLIAKKAAGIELTVFEKYILDGAERRVAGIDRSPNPYWKNEISPADAARLSAESLRTVYGDNFNRDERWPRRGQ